MADVTLESTEEIIQLVSVSGASQGDIVAAVAVETAAREAADTAHAALTTGVHGVGASTVASAANVASAVSAHNALATAHAGAQTFSGTKTFDFGALASGQARTVFEFKPLSGSAADPSNFLVMNTQEFDVSSPFCSSMYFGFNLGAGGTRVMAGHPAIGFVTEGNWFQSGVQYAEAHCFYLTKANVQHRPFSITVNADTDFITFAHYADSYGFSSKGGYSVISVTAGVDSANSSIALHAPIHHDASFQFDAGGSFNCAVNNVVWLNQLNAAGNAYLNIAYVDNGNTLILGGAGVSKIFTSNTFQGNGDFDHYGAKFGMYGKGAIAQQVLATGAGATVDNVITVLQNIGLCKQS